MHPVLITLQDTGDDQAYHYDCRQRVTFGRSNDNTHQLSGQQVSRQHCYLEIQDGKPIFFDTSINGILVDNQRVNKQITLQNGARLQIGSHNFIFTIDIDSFDDEKTILENVEYKVDSDASNKKVNVLKVTVTGGGPVGLSFALILESLMGGRVAIKVYDGRWTQEGSRIVWKNKEQGNTQRQQIVTIQSEQYLKLPKIIQDRIFQEGCYSEMWPKGSDTIGENGPRNVRIAHIEDQLLEIANEKPERIQLIPTRFDPEKRPKNIEDQHVLAICEGSRSRTRESFKGKFGKADKSMYSLDGDHLQDVVLGLKVKSDLPDAMAVLLSVVQNRFLLNSLDGDGYLNIRLTDEEVKEVVGIDLNNLEFKNCIQSEPCVMERTGKPYEFSCTTHGTLFLPAILKGSVLWARILEGLKLFEVKEENLSAITIFRLDMVQRPRFTAQLYPHTKTTPGMFGFLLGDAANAIHFWHGRGLNSGIASAISLARCLKHKWRGKPYREADFLLHEALMSMLQYRHKSRAWQSMVATDSNGNLCAVKNMIKQGILEAENGTYNKNFDISELLSRLRQIRDRLKNRINELPDDDTLREHLTKLDGRTLRTLVSSGSWDTYSVSGEEVDIDLLLGNPDSLVLPVHNKCASIGRRAGPLKVINCV